MYPLMLYRGGVVLTDYKIVNSQAEETAAEGYARLDLPRATALLAGVPMAEPEPQAAPAAPAEAPIKRGPGRPRKTP